jgi:hypothetical protein
MAKITPRKQKDTVVMRTQPAKSLANAMTYEKWWLANSKKELADRLITTVGFLKQSQQYRYRQAAIYARLYGNMPIFNSLGSDLNKSVAVKNLPIDRPTMNVVQSCVDTLVSRVTQSKPMPRFLTDNSDYKERTLAKQMNTFINGELYQTKANQLVPLLLRDAAVLGTGALKVYKGPNEKVGLDRVLLTELLVDPNDAFYGSPRQLFQLKLVDRSVLQDIFPDHKSEVAKAEQAFPDESGDSSKTIADQVMIAEAWRLPSGKDTNDGRHSIVCSSGVIFDEEYKKDNFPFVFLHYSPRLTGFWGQGLSEQLMGTQVEINKLLMTISQSINLVGVPRVFVEDGSKVVKAHLNNMIGAVITYSGTKPSYEVAPCVPQELYAQLERLVQYAYQQSGISSLSAMGNKPAGLNSGTALRSYDDIQSDRFADLVKRYDQVFVDLAYQIIDSAKEIAEETGSYSTVYPNKDGTKEIDLPASKMLKDSYVIQCFDTSSLPRDPAGRLQDVIERMQAGLLSQDEGRRLLGFPDLEQVDKLDNAAEERILKILDEIVESGKYTPPDAFMNLPLAKELSIKYYNLYSEAKLEQSKADMLRTFSVQVQGMLDQAMNPVMPMGEVTPSVVPAAVPEAAPVSEMIPNIPQQ